MGEGSLTSVVSLMVTIRDKVVTKKMGYFNQPGICNTKMYDSAYIFDATWRSVLAKTKGKAKRYFFTKLACSVSQGIG